MSTFKSAEIPAVSYGVKGGRYKVNPNRAEEFFANKNTTSQEADEAALDWLNAYPTSSDSEKVRGRLTAALQAHKAWSDSNSVKPLSNVPEIRHNRRMSKIQDNLDGWGNLMSDEGFEGAMEKRGMIESYHKLLDRGLDENIVRDNFRRKLITKDLAGGHDAVSQARIGRNLFELEDLSDESFLQGAQGWVNGQLKERQDIESAADAATDAFILQMGVSNLDDVARARQEQKEISPSAAKAFDVQILRMKKDYGDVIPLARQLIEEVREKEGTRDGSEVLDLTGGSLLPDSPLDTLFFDKKEGIFTKNYLKLEEVYRRGDRDKFLYMVGKLAEEKGSDVEGTMDKLGLSISRGFGNMSESLLVRKPLAGAEDDLRKAGDDKSADILKYRLQIFDDIRNLDQEVARVKGSNMFTQGVYDASGSLTYMAMMAHPVSLAAAALSIQEDHISELQRQNPDISRDKARWIASVSSPIEVSIERLQLGTAVGRLPGISSAIKKLSGGGLLRRLTFVAGAEYTQETVQEAVLPTVQEIVSVFDDEVPEGDWDNFKVMDARRFFAVLPISLLGGGGQYAAEKIKGADPADQFTREELSEIMRDTAALRLVGFSKEEAAEISKVALSDPRKAIGMMREKRGDQTPEEREKAGQEAVSEIFGENLSMEQEQDGDLFDYIPKVRPTGDGQFKLTFPGGDVQVADSKEEVQVIVEQRAQEEFNDAAQAVRDRMDNLLETSEGDNKAEIAKPRTFQELADLRVETVERLKEAVAVSYMQRGEAAPETIDLNNYTEQGSVTLRRKMAGFAVRLAKDKMTLPTTVDEEFSEGFLRLIVERGETTFDEVKTMLDEFGAIAGIDMTQGYDVDPNRAVIEGFSKFAKAYMLQGNHDSIPKSSQAWYRKAWRVLENPDSVPAPLRAFAELVTKLLRSVFDVAKAIEFHRKDGNGIDPELESLAMRALGLDEKAYAERMQEQYQQEILDDLYDPTFSIGNTTVTPNAETKTYPTKDGGVVGPASFSITAHHGTPHKVDKFSTEKIGTGEGAQAYGWGLYFAEALSVAKGYRDTLSKSGTDGAKRRLEKAGGDIDAALATAKEKAGRYRKGGADSLAGAVEEDIRFLEKYKDSGEWTSGSLYTVELNVEQDELLDLDKVLSEQSELVREALSDFMAEDAEYLERYASGGFGERVGSNVVSALDRREGGAPQASKALLGRGIKGLRYLDGDSRAGGEGTSNYVIFDDADIKITEENGQVVDTSSPSFSITPAQDAEYMAAVESGDVETQQKLVDEAAKMAGYNSGPVFHGTRTKGFDRFDPEKTGQVDDGYLGDGFYFDSEEKTSKMYTEVPFAPSGKNVKKVGAWSVARGANRTGALGRFYLSGNLLSLSEELFDDGPFKGGVKDRPVLVRERLGLPMDSSAKDVTKTAIRDGYDGVEYKSKFGTEIVVFNPNQAKSADPITRDADGNVIPLSQRFDASRDEISFSITPKDEQMSEAVDQIFNGSSRFAEFSDKVRKRKEDILARYREQYAKADSESERAIIEVESLAQAEGLYMALPSRMKAIKSEIEEVAELIVERRSGVDSLKMKEDEGFRSVILPFKLPKAVSEFRIIKALRNNLTARGRLTREQHKIKMAAEATQLAELKEAEQVVARLRKQINKTVKGEVARDMLMRQAQEVATGDAKMDTLPQEIQPIVQEARDQVDRLSQKMIDSGIAKGDLAQVFERQMGNYLNRSYRRFTRPESWEKEVPQEARDAAKEYLRKELPADAYTPGISKDEQLDGYVENLLKDSVSGSMMDSMTALLGQKHLGNLIGRKSIPKPIRDLWGEYKRLDENYLNSVRKMAGQVASHSILEDFKKDGLGDIIFEKPRKGFATPITAEGNDALAPLDGYHVSEEMAQALKDFAELGKKEIGTWLKWWLKFNSTAKVSKTIYNPTTHARNFFSNFGYVLANDNFFEYARSGKDSAVINFKEIFGFARTPEIEDRIRYYVRLGIMHQGAVSQEFKDILKDFSAGEVDIEEYSQKKLLKIAKAPLDVIQAAYQAEDDFHKIVAFESEKRKLAKHKKNWSQEKIDREAAQIIRDTMPDYSQVPTAVKALRRVPLVGTFTSFTAEVLRNNHNIIARAITEMKDPDLKVVGIRRMSFFMMAHAVPIALAAFLKEMFDVDDEEDEATRAIAAPWDKDSLLMYVGRSPSGDPKYANFSYTDPFSIFKTPFIISQREGLSATSLTKGVMKGLEPFYGVEIGTKALIETFEGEDDLGRKISNDNDDVLTQTKDRAIHLLKALEPGFLRTGERIRRAYTGEKTPSGKEFDLATEIGAVITGQRVTTVRRQDAVKYRTWEFTDDKRNASTNFNKAWRDGEADRESLTKAVEDYRRDTKLAFEGYQDVLRAVSVLGLSDDEILAAGYDNPTTPTAKIAQSLLDAKVGETPIPEKKFSKSHLKEIREIEGREELLRELIPEAF